MLGRKQVAAPPPPPPEPHYLVTLTGLEIRQLVGLAAVAALLCVLLTMLYLRQRAARKRIRSFRILAPDARAGPETMRLMLAATGQLELLDDVRYPIDASKMAQGLTAAMPAYAAAKAAGRHDANLGRLPVMEVDGVSLGQVSAMERLVAKRLGLQGRSDLEAARIDMLVEHLGDIRKGARRMVLPAPPRVLTPAMPTPCRLPGRQEARARARDHVVRRLAARVGEKV